MRKIKYYILCFLVICIACNCNETEKEANHPSPTPTPAIVPPSTIPVFNSDSAFFYIEKQLSFGPRVPNTEMHDACGAWLAEKLRSLGQEVIIQETVVEAYNGTKLEIQNIIGQYNMDAVDRILLCAHWDTRPFADQDVDRQDEPIPGANDGGSGVAVLLEVARQLSIAKPEIGIDIIFFDAEDYGQPLYENLPVREDTYCLGSQYWSNNLHKKNYQPMYGILLDMVGAKDAVFTMEDASMRYAPYVTRKVWNAAARAGYSGYFRFEKIGAHIDDHVYINTIAKIKCIDIIQYDYTTPSTFGAYWHTHKDNIWIIDKKTLKAVGQTLLQVIYEELGAIG
ncbi:MAG: M28 family peptidase [Bacteroidetes bacterium]|nr:M28 family peptidase [Bacteroidota bacterium]